MINDLMKKEFSWIRHHTRFILVLLLASCILLLLSSYIKAILFALVFIALGGASKLYHRFFRSTIGIDLVLFFALMCSLVYHNIILSFLVGFIGLFIADSLALRFSHTTLVSYVGLAAVIIFSIPLSGVPLKASLILLTIAYEAISIALYHMMGSSPDKILLFLSTHLLFNMFLILNFSSTLAAWMV